MPQHHPSTLPRVPVADMADADVHRVAGASLPGRWRLLGQGVWVVVLILTLVLFAAGLPMFAAQLQTVCVEAGCRRWQPSPELAQGLAQFGLSLRFYATYYILLEAVRVLLSCLLAAIIFRRKSDEGIGLFAALMLVLFGGVLFTDPIYLLGTSSPTWRWPVTFMAFLGSVSLVIFFYLFPDGRFVPRWTRWAAAAWTGLNLVGFFSPRDWFLNEQGGPLFPLAALGFFGSVVVAQVYRYRRVSGPARRQQTKWVVFGFTTAILGLSLVILLQLGAPLLLNAGPVVHRLLGVTSFYGFLSLIPLSIGVAILRYRLWDIDLVINRTLVYGVLTACVVGLYALVVGSLGALFRSDGNLVISLVATGTIAVLFQPLRERLQRGVNRLLYGERDDPYAVLSRLGRRLEATLAPDAVLPTVVQTVREALKLPYAAIALKRDDDLVVAAASGAPPVTPLRLPLVYQQEAVGELILAPRAPGEPLGPADRRLLDDLARQAGVSAHAVCLNDRALRLAADLQRSRERLVTAREEERRRLRRDLHDGLAPTLAALNLQAGSIRTLVGVDPRAAEAQIDGWRAEMRGAIADIRRLAYELRPPVLDELGLVAAVHELAARLGPPGNDGRLRVAVQAPEHLAPLPAAVEVAAYRIIQEALTNVARHARARTCQVRLRVAEEPPEALDLEIADDGVGLAAPPGGRAGVGLLSMRERAAELGGACVVESAPLGGARVRVWLPLTKE